MLNTNWYANSFYLRKMSYSRWKFFFVYFHIRASGQNNKSLCCIYIRTWVEFDNNERYCRIMSNYANRSHKYTKLSASRSQDIFPMFMKNWTEAWRQYCAESETILITIRRVVFLWKIENHFVENNRLSYSRKC